MVGVEGGVKLEIRVPYRHTLTFVLIGHSNSPL